jgi:hypothetical protein
MPVYPGALYPLLLHRDLQEIAGLSRDLIRVSVCPADDPRDGAARNQLLHRPHGGARRQLAEQGNKRQQPLEGRPHNPYSTALPWALRAQATGSFRHRSRLPP